MSNAKINIILIPAILMVTAVCGQVTLTKTSFKGREAYALQNDNIRITMLTGGGYIGELNLLSLDQKESINPLFTPHYETIDPHDYDTEKHGNLYGTGVNAKLMAGYMGHYICFPYFGRPNSDFEEESGSGTHGEAYTVKYEVEKELKTESAIVRASAILPLTKYSINRTITLLQGQSVVLVEEDIENLENFDRPYQWVQHVTFGKPFVEYGKTFVDAPVSRIAFNQDENDPNSQTVSWPFVRTENGDEINAGVFSADRGEGGYRAWFIEPEEKYTWFTMYNKDLKLLVGYVFEKDGNPWIGDWMENQRDQKIPRNGKVVAWGLEVGTTPFGSGIRRVIDRGPIYNTETYDWVGAKEKKKQAYMIFLLEIDKSFKGVKSLKLEKGNIILTEKETEMETRIAHGFSFLKQ
ncbi:MAG: hypothetical protein RIC06_25920 [Cyclobacteriaceae bacterium]